MDRREALVGLVAIGASSTAFGQSPRKVAKVGILYLSSPASSTRSVDALRAALKPLGYVEGRTIEFDLRSANGRVERLAELAAQLVASKVDVIVTGGGNLSVFAARKATSIIPIVMTSSVDAVEEGLIASLARPGRNITGLTIPSEFAGKQIELLRELVPSLNRIAILIRPDANAAARRAQSKAMVQELLRVTIEFVEVSEPEHLPAALASVRSMRAGALLVGPDPLFYHQKDELLAFARAGRLPAIYPIRDFVDAGGLLSYSVNSAELYRSAASYVDRILKGAKPADLPVEEPRETELVINLQTAKAMGLAVSQSLLTRANEVIQ